MPDRYLLDPGPAQPPLDGHEVERRVASERAVEATLDPLDEWPEEALTQMWLQDGRRLVEREQAMSRLAGVRRWSFVALDAALSARLYDADLTADVPRVARNVCRATDGTPVACDLTGLVVDVDSDPTFARHLRVRAASAVLVPFHGRDGHRIVVQPAGSESTTWERFGPGLTTESPEFDAAFSVYVRDPAWGQLMLNPSVMDRLLRARPVTLVVSGGYLALLRPGFVPTDDVLRMVDVVTGIAFSASAAAWHPTT